MKLKRTKNCAIFGATLYIAPSKKSYSYIHTVPETNSNYAPQTNWQIDKSNRSGGPKKAQLFYVLTSSNINCFSKLFYCQNREKTCNNTY